MIFKSKKAIEIDVASKIKSNEQFLGDVLAIPTVSFTTDFSRQLGNEITILSFEPDSIVFNFSDRIVKRLPVRLNATFVFEKQYDSSGHTLLQPDSINVSGPPSVIENMNFVETEKLQIEDVKSSIHRTVKLVPNKLLTFATDIVTIKVPVEKFTEGRTEVPVHPMNVDPGYSLKTFPDKIMVRYQVALSRYNDVDAGQFDAVVDGAKLVDQNPAKIPVQLMTAPSYIRAIFIEPEKVDYILRKR